LQPSIGLARSTLPTSARRLTLNDVAMVAGLLAIEVGITVLLGWLLGLDALKSLVPGLLTMKANTAITFVLMGIGLFLAARADTAGTRLAAVIPLAAGLVLVSITGSQYVFGRDFGIDQWLFREPPGQIGTLQPNRMSPMTVISFLLIGTAIILAIHRRATRITPALLVGAAFLGALNLLDLVFQASTPSLLAGQTQMALSTALATLGLSLGAIALPAARGALEGLDGQSPSAQLARRLVLASLVVPIVFAWLRLQGEGLGVYGTRDGASLMVLGTFGFLTVMVIRGSRSSERNEAARRAVIEERDRFFDVSIDMLATASASGTFVRLNPAWTKTLGYELETLMSRPFVEFVHPDDIAATNTEVARQVNEGKSVLNFRNRYRHLDGSYRWLEWTSSPSADGSLLYAVARDVTERKLEEERLRAPEMALARRLAEAEDKIGATIEHEAFAPVFQPIIELSTGAIVGYEALTRFSDGSRADETFAMALECGLGKKLEAATVAVALAAARQLPAQAWLSLNVSPSFLADVDRLGAALGLRTRQLVLEITEHEAIETYGPLRDAALRLGPDVRLAVDDAGAGVANFHHLVELRPDFVKIDASLVRGVDTDVSRQAVVAGILHFAATAQCQVIAEGVETKEELAKVIELGVSLGQGYLLGRPAPAGDWLEDAMPQSPILRRLSNHGAKGALGSTG
jgi:PAS domain S-box-containing protein